MSRVHPGKIFLGEDSREMFKSPFKDIKESYVAVWAALMVSQGCYSFVVGFYMESRKRVRPRDCAAEDKSSNRNLMTTRKILCY